ncbi:hypothetical protein BGZ61DRAFT_570544, partial [Ilyonectria robusta]|uniref:uncharacterized protein n=1 Tax=Ilyonectria robusta TaxID=1079257 RepID=UPI001E8E3621
INWDPKRHRIRCILHIINISLQAFLFASSREALQAALGAASDVTGDELYERFYLVLHDASGGDTSNQPDQTRAQTRRPGGVASKKASVQQGNPPSRTDNRLDNTTSRKGWFMIPALRKLHRIGLWLRNSAIHSDAWDERIKLRLGIDNDTRWNSWYRMIDNLMRKKQQRKHTHFSNLSHLRLCGLKARRRRSRKTLLSWIYYFAITSRSRNSMKQKRHMILSCCTRLIWAGSYLISTILCLRSHLSMQLPSSSIRRSERDTLRYTGRRNGRRLPLRTHVQSGRKNTRWRPPSDLPSR